MSISDVSLVLGSKQARQKELAQLLAWIVYNGAALCGVAINEPKKFPRLEDAFPSLFEHKAQQDWRVMKARMERYAEMKKNA